MKLPQDYLEIEVAAGVEQIALAELRKHLRSSGKKNLAAANPQPGIIQTLIPKDLGSILELRTANSVYVVKRFDIPRPKALLGDEHFRRLVGGIDQVFEVAAWEEFKTLYISAAGRDSRVLSRLKAELCRVTGLKDGIDDGDLLLRLRRPVDHAPGWEVLIRLSPRPLSVRAWRVCNYPGALNAPVAQAMVSLSRPQISDAVLNIGCGSGTIMIERLAWGRAKEVVGCDLNSDALACAIENFRAAGVADLVNILRTDGRNLPFESSHFDVLFSDFPFGSLVGSHRENLDLYPGLLSEGARVIRPDGLFVLITHEVRLIESKLKSQSNWRQESVLRVSLRGLSPRIYQLRRTRSN